MRFGRDDDDGVTANLRRIKKREKESRKAVRRFEIAEGRASTGGNGCACFIRLIALSSLNRSVVHPLALHFSVPRTVAALSTRASKSYRFTDVVRAFALSATVDSSGDSSSHVYHGPNDDQIKLAQSRNCFHSFLIAFIPSVGRAF